MTESPPHDPAALRARLAADIAQGKTVSLSAEELADPEIRRQLPDLLDELTGRQANPGAPTPIPGITLLTEIGHGGMSTVYLARQNALRRHVALKIAPKWLASDKRMRERLLQEARAMARVSHPNIVAIHDILEVDDTIAIAMDWIDGLPLSRLLAELPPQPSDRDVGLMRAALGTPAPVPADTSAMHFFVRAIRDIARAVHHVHATGLLHLDIKPSNILVRADGTPLLADFGVVREIDLETTHTRTFAGTPVYAAPEQLRRDDARFGPHTDVYALGMTLYEMLARIQPLRQLSLTRVLQDVLGGRIAPLSSRVPVAADLANIVHKAIAPEIEQRYATAAELADDLTAFLEHRPVVARPLTKVQRLQRWARNEPWKAALAAVLLVLVPSLLGLGTYLLLQMPRIEQSRREDRLAEASRLKQEAYLEYFVTHGVTGRPSNLLIQAMERDPGPSSLACLLAMAHEEGMPVTDEYLQKHHATVQAHLGLRLFGAKVAARRAFFVADEVQQLRASTDVVDKYVLALDRIFHAEDGLDEEGYLEAEQALDEAALMANADALLYGLRLWAAGRAERPERHAAITRAIQARWGHDPQMMSWLYYSLEPLDHAAAIRIAEQLQTDNPAHPASWEMLSGEACRRGEFNEALTRIDAAKAAGVNSDKLKMFRWLSLAFRDGKAAAEQALREIPADLLTDTRRHKLQHVADPAFARASLFQQLLQDPRTPARFEAVYVEAQEANQLDIQERTWALWREHHPDRRGLHQRRIRTLFESKNYEQLSKLLGECMLPKAASSTNWQQVCRMLITAQAWDTLARYARRWITLATDEQRPEPTFYLALADLRRGNFAAGMPNLSAALAARHVKLTWYGTALLEDAWMRVLPKGPTDWHDKVLAQRRIAELDAFVAEVRSFTLGPWAHLVRAEVLYANGDAAKALEVLHKGGRRVEGQAPTDLPELQIEAMDRYRRN